MRLVRLTALAPILVAACMGDMGMMIPDVIDVPASAGRFDTVAAVDRDPSPTVVEVALEARVAEVELAPGHVTRCGPTTARCRGRGSRPTSATPCGALEELAARSHDDPLARRAGAGGDGRGRGRRRRSRPGAEFTYEFVVPDAGTFWFHPHVRSDVQVERGLYGALRGATARVSPRPPPTARWCSTTCCWRPTGTMADLRRRAGDGRVARAT
jgi:hypothetical protein